MSVKVSAVLVLLTSLIAPTVWSADVAVAPGVDTLSDAIAAAGDGDTLILQTGTYSGTVVVNKSLTIRANTNNADALVSGSFTIAGAGISVVVQGLDFSTEINVDQAADVKILQNTLLNGANINLTDYKTSEGDGTLAVIGNHLTQNGDIAAIYSNDAYIAGNVLDLGYINSKVSVWIVGNSVVGYGGTNPVPPIEVKPNTGIVQIIGNRVIMNGIGDHRGIDVLASYALIAGNIVTVNHGIDHNEAVDAIHAGGVTVSTIINNIVHRGTVSANLNTSYGIWGSGRILGNIVFNLSNSGFIAISGFGSVEILDNLCYNNKNNRCGSSPVTSHPQFENDLHLAANSPAIDAGPIDFAFSDLDRTRNDIGAYGGPWNIEQYDAQRDPNNFGPYVYPLFKADSAFTDGSIEVRALGVARLR